MNEILRFMQKHDERTDRRTDGRTDVRKAFYNLPTSAFGRRREIIMTQHITPKHKRFKQSLHTHIFTDFTYLL